MPGTRAEMEVPSARCRYSYCAQSMLHYLLRLADNRVQVLLTPEALGVNFVDVLRAGRPCGKPSAIGNNFKSTDGRIIPRRPRQLGDDPFPGQRQFAYVSR